MGERPLILQRQKACTWWKETTICSSSSRRVSALRELCFIYPPLIFVMVMNMIMPNVACRTRLFSRAQSDWYLRACFLLVQPYQEVSPGKQGLRGCWSFWTPVPDTASHHLWLCSHINLSKSLETFCVRGWLAHISLQSVRRGDGHVLLGVLSVYYLSLRELLSSYRCICMEQNVFSSCMGCALYYNHRGQAVPWLT